MSEDEGTPASAVTAAASSFLGQTEDGEVMEQMDTASSSPPPRTASAKERGNKTPPYHLTGLMLHALFTTNDV